MGNTGKLKQTVIVIVVDHLNIVQTMSVCVVEHFVFMMGNTSKLEQTVSVSVVDHLILLIEFTSKLKPDHYKPIFRHTCSHN